MEVVKETKEYKVIKKRSGRFAVKSSDGKWVNGLDKTKILLSEGLIKTGVPSDKPQEEAAPKAEEAPAEETASEEAPAEEAAE